MAFATLQSVKVEGVKALAPDRAIVQTVLTLELKGALSFTLEDQRKEKVSTSRCLVLSKSEPRTVGADRMSNTCLSRNEVRA